MFNVAYSYLCNLWRNSDPAVEVNPAHAPTALLWLILVEKLTVMRAVTGRHELARQDHTLYPYFFPAAEEARNTEDLLRAEPR
jgi:hypothetical protein